MSKTVKVDHNCNEKMIVMFGTQVQDRVPLPPPPPRPGVTQSGVKLVHHNAAKVGGSICTCNIKSNGSLLIICNTVLA